jgi:hypothetical protein
MSLKATRRTLLATALAGVAGPLRAATPIPEAATLLAPGPERGPAAAFAADAARGLPRGLLQAAALRVSVLGGPDGITAANRFAASTPADGQLLLALPGQAGYALLLGDPRARYEPRNWPALSASLAPAILAGRGPLNGTSPVRIALPGPAAPEVGALLALDLLGRPASTVFSAVGMTSEALVAAGAADALVLTGTAAAARAASLGLTPWFAFDTEDGARDPALPQLPTLAEQLPDPAVPEFLAAARAAGAALRLRGLLVLPALTSADTVAMWRDAARRWVETEPAAADSGTRHAAPEEAARLHAALCPGPEAGAAYRDWLQRRLNWRAT